MLFITTLYMVTQQSLIKMERNTKENDKIKPNQSNLIAFTPQQKENSIKFNGDKLLAHKEIKKYHKLSTHNKIINLYSHQIPRCLIGLKNITIFSQTFQKHRIAWIVGKIYEVNAISKNLKFCGTCFMITNEVVVTSAHQVSSEKGKQYVLKFPNSNQYNSFDVYNSGRVWVNENYSRLGQINYSEDYAFIEIIFSTAQINSKQEMKKLGKADRIGQLKFTFFEDDGQIKSQRLSTRIYGCADVIPDQLKNKWNNKFTKKEIILSIGDAILKEGQLEYELSTVNGMSGSPIIHEYNGTICVIGMHTSGNQFKQKNYGLLFRKSFYINLKRQFPDLKQLKQSPLNDAIETIQTLQDYLNSKVAIFKSLKEKYDFLGKILNKIVTKISQFQKLRLSIESLSPQDIIVTKIINQSKRSRRKQQPQNKEKQATGFQIEFKRLKLIDFPLQKVAQLQHYNINSLVNILYKIEKTGIPKQYKEAKQKQKGERFRQTFPFSIPKAKQQYLFHMIAYFIQQNMQQLNDVEPYQRIQCIKDSIIYEFTDKKPDNKHQQLVSEKLDEIKSKKGVQIPFDFYKHFSLHQYEMNLEIFRRKLCYWYKYSNFQLDSVAITGFYLVHLSILHKKIIRTYHALQILYQANYKERHLRNSEIQMLQDKQKQASSLKDLPDFHFLLSDFKSQYEVSKFNLKEKRQYYEHALFKQLKEQLKGQRQVDSIVTELVKCQTIFYEIIEKRYLKIKFIDNIAKFTEAKLYYNIYQQMVDKKDKSTLSKLKVCLQQEAQQIKQNIFLTQSKVLERNPQIFNYKIFKTMFRQPQHKVYSYKLTQVGNNDEQLQDLKKIIVRVEKQDGASLGTGFMLTQKIVCTALHLFDQLDYQQIKSCKIKNDDKTAEIKEVYPEELLSAQQRSNNQFADIVFLEIKDSADFKLKDTEKISIILHDQLPLFAESKHFGVLMGYGKPQNNTTSILKKSYGQFEFGDNNCHPLTGQSHLSGSPMLLRFDNTYAVIGVYKSDQSSNKLKIGKYTKFNAEQLENLNFFQENNIKMMTIGKQSNKKIKSTLKIYIQENYKTIDHFILRILGEVLRLNYCYIFLQKLSFKNLILNREDNRNIIFSDLKLLPNTNNQAKDYTTRRSFNQQKIKQNTIKNKEAIYNFLIQFKKILKNEDQQDIKDSVLLNNKNLGLIKQCESFQDYFLSHIESKYDFKDNNLVLKQKPQYLEKVKIIENKYERHFNRKPSERFRIQSIILNQLMQTQPSICSSQRMSNISKFYRNDLDELVMRSQQPKDSFFSIAYALFNKGAANIISKLAYKKDQEFDQKFIFSENPNEQKCDLQKHTKFLEQLCENSHIDAEEKNKFIEREKEEFIYSYHKIKNWTFISNIIKIYKCMDELPKLKIGKFSINFDSEHLDETSDIFFQEQYH